MPTNLSNNKIILLVVFACSAIMASLFVYHMSHKPTLTILANGNTTLFPVARDIKSFELRTATNEKFTQQNFRQHWTILFFGFTHCNSICPTTLTMLGKAYDKLHAAHPDLQVVFVSLDPMRDTLPTLAKYLNTFNPAFIGVTGDIQTIRKLQSQFGIFSAREQSTADDYQIQHSTSIALINPAGQWVGLFKFGMREDEFIQAYNAGIQQHA